MPEQVKERRLRESQRVEERVHVIFSYEEFQQQLEQARARTFGFNHSTMGDTFVCVKRVCAVLRLRKGHLPSL